MLIFVSSQIYKPDSDFILGNPDGLLIVINPIFIIKEGSKTKKARDFSRAKTNFTI